MNPRVLFLHWRGAALPGWRRMLDAGAMPRFARLAAGGVLADLMPTPPFGGAAGSATIATGCLADAHGILADREPRPDLLGLRPASRTSRRRSAVWEIAHREGLRSMAVAWPATHPAYPTHPTSPTRPSPDAAAIVTDAFAEHRSRHPDCWPMPSACVFPEALRDELWDLRLSAPEITPEQLGALVPGLAEIDQARDDTLVRLAAALARCATDHAAGTFLAEHGPDGSGPRGWDLLCVHFALAGEAWLLRTEGRERSLRADGTSPLDEAPGHALAFLDLMLGRYLHLCGPETTVVISGDAPPSEGADPAPGFLLASGPGVRPGTSADRARAMDVAPTVLALLGVPPAADLDGRALGEILTNPAPEERWTHEVPGEPSENIDRERIEAMAADLRERGYAAPAVAPLMELQEHAAEVRQVLETVRAVRSGAPAR